MLFYSQTRHSFVFHQSVDTKRLRDAYLLGLAVRNHGRLVTFDRSIPTKAVLGSMPGNLVLLGNS